MADENLLPHVVSDDIIEAAVGENANVETGVEAALAHLPDIEEALRKTASKPSSTKVEPSEAATPAPSAASQQPAVASPPQGKQKKKLPMLLPKTGQEGLNLPPVQQMLEQAKEKTEKPENTASTLPKADPVVEPDAEVDEGWEDTLELTGTEVPPSVDADTMPEDVTVSAVSSHIAHVQEEMKHQLDGLRTEMREMLQEIKESSNKKDTDILNRIRKLERRLPHDASTSQPSTSIAPQEDKQTAAQTAPSARSDKQPTSTLAERLALLRQKKQSGNVDI